jgi:hypothetical protein
LGEVPEGNGANGVDFMSFQEGLRRELDGLERERQG